MDILSCQLMEGGNSSSDTRLSSMGKTLNSSFVTKLFVDLRNLTDVFLFDLDEESL